MSLLFAPKFSSLPDLRAVGLEILPMVYAATDNRPDPVMPDLWCIAGKKNVFVKAACRDMAKYLLGKGVKLAVFDFEPGDHGDFAGWTPQNCETAEWTVKEFADNGVTLRLFGVLDPDKMPWLRKLNGDVVYVSMYDFSDDPDEFYRAYLKGICALRKAQPGAKLTGWFSPIQQRNGPGYGKPLPRAFLDAQNDLGDLCDGDARWAAQFVGEQLAPLDPSAEWFKHLLDRARKLK